jgi:hypothetical protein
MQSLLDGRGCVVMDEVLIDAARRALFASVGARNQEFPDLHFVRQFLKRYASAVAVIDGQEIEPLGEDIQLAYAAGPERQRRDGQAPFLLYDAYQDAVMRAGGPTHARFAPEVLHQVVPANWLPAVGALLADGPEIGAVRAQAAIYDYSLGMVEGNRRRVSGRRARSSVKVMFNEATRLLRVAHGLRGLSACRHWTYVPQLAMPDMPRGGYETVAPRVETMRQAWQGMTAEIHERLGTSSIEDELRALDSLSDDTLAARGLWRLARDRMLLVLMVLTGGRRNAIARLCREDYISDCEGPMPDCRRGAALDLRPRKGKGREEVRRKPIPHQAALVLDTYLTLMDRMLAAKGHAPAPSCAPLLVAEPSHYAKPIRQQWLYHRVAGGKTNGWRPLVSRDPRHLPRHVPEEERPYCGYTPHEYRHFANKLAERAGEVWSERHPASGGESSLPSAYYAAALLDNGGIEQDLRALYGDRQTPAMLEVVSGRAAEIAWEILTTGAGMRKRPDIAAYERELIRLRQIEDEERRLHQSSQQLQARHARCGQRAFPPTSGTGGDRLDVILRRQEELVASIDELKEITLESTAITHQLVQLSRQKADTIVKLDLYRLDQATWLPVPDFEPPGAEHVDWEAIDQGTLGKPLMVTGAPAAVRDWLTFREFCDLAGLEARSTLTRWVKGEHVPSRRDKRPWEPDSAPVDASLGINYRRIWVSGVHDAFWRTNLMREALAEALGRWPMEQGWTTKDGEPTWRCSEPLRVSPLQLQLAA